MSDLMADPRAQDLLDVDPEEIGRISGYFAHVANQGANALASLGRIAAAPNWSGDAYEVMQSNIATMHPHLSTISDVYGQSSRALSNYHDVVSDVQPRFVAVTRQLSDLSSQIGQLSSTYSTQSSIVRADARALDNSLAAGADAATLKTMLTATIKERNEAQGTQARLTAAQDLHGELHNLGMALLEQFSDSRDSTSSQVVSVALQAPVSESALQIILSGIADGVAASRAGAGIAGGQTKHKGHPPEKIGDLNGHPTSLAAGSVAAAAAAAAGAAAAAAGKGGGAKSGGGDDDPKAGDGDPEVGGGTIVVSGGPGTGSEGPGTQTVTVNGVSVTSGPDGTVVSAPGDDTVTVGANQITVAPKGDKPGTSGSGTEIVGDDGPEVTIITSKAPAPPVHANPAPKPKVPSGGGTIVVD